MSEQSDSVKEEGFCWPYYLPYIAWVLVGVIAVVSLDQFKSELRESVALVLLCASFVGFARQVRSDWVQKIKGGKQ